MLILEIYSNQVGGSGTIVRRPTKAVIAIRQPSHTNTQFFDTLSTTSTLIGNIMATISHLPVELVEYVYGYLAQPELCAVARVNKGSHKLAMPFFYRDVDLFIGPSDSVPRIDRFCMNILEDPRLAARVETVRLGPSPHEGVKEGQRWVPRDAQFDDNHMNRLIDEFMDNESLFAKGDHFKDALLMREYGAYCALIFMVLPNLRELQIADFNCASLDHFHTVLRNLNPGSARNGRHASEGLMRRLSNISEVSFNADKLSGVTYPKYKCRFNVGPVLSLPGVKKICFSIPDGHHVRSRHFQIQDGHMANITSMEIRHSESALLTLQPLLDTAVQLRSLTYDFFYDCKEGMDVPSRSLDLAAWSEALPKSLKTLVLSVEHCDTSAYPFKQPLIGEKLFGYLDLTNMTNLHTVEVPFPFLTGDAGFSITTDIYPLLPPTLKHLSLRTDLSHAQHQFPFDTSVLSKSLTYQESQDEARSLNNARMDVSCMFHAAMVILDFAKNLEAISIWQPADPSLAWFDGQIADFAQTCRNKSIRGHVVYPLILRWKKPEHWNLVKDVTVFDPKDPSNKHHEVLYRGERAGIPLGLASQYHLHALRNHQVRLR